MKAARPRVGPQASFVREEAGRARSVRAALYGPELPSRWRRRGKVVGVSGVVVLDAVEARGDRNERQLQLVNEREAPLPPRAAPLVDLEGQAAPRQIALLGAERKGDVDSVLPAPSLGGVPARRGVGPEAGGVGGVAAGARRRRRRRWGWAVGLPNVRLRGLELDGAVGRGATSLEEDDFVRALQQPPGRAVEPELGAPAVVAREAVTYKQRVSLAGRQVGGNAD
jgi:hypothetical protein